MIEDQLPREIMLYSKCLSYPLPFYATLINNPLLDTMVLANHDKVEGH